MIKTISAVGLAKRIDRRSRCKCTANACTCQAKGGGILLASAYAASGYRASGFGDDVVRRGIKEAQGKLTYSDDGMTFKEAGFKLDRELDAKEIEYRDKHKITPVMDFEAVITTTAKDRDSDILECEGAEVDAAMPLLWQHIPEMPIGKFLRVTYRDKNMIRGASSIIDTPDGRHAAQLLEFGSLRISHGFKPKRVEQMQQAADDLWAGFHIPAYRMFEKSLVSVPSNPEAVIVAHDRLKFIGDSLVKSWVQERYRERPTIVQSGYDPAKGGERIKRYAVPVPEAETLRWDSSLPAKAFDVDNAELQPSSTLIDWVGKWLEVPTKSIFQTTIPVPGVRMGTFLTALKHVMGEMGFKEESVRNVWGTMESPPQYEKIRLNSTKSDTFLTKGTAFLSGKDKLVIDYDGAYFGIELTFFSTWPSRHIVDELVMKTQEWAARNNFLRGEKFSVSGKFLDRTGEDFADLFLEPVNEKAITRVLDRLNAKGASFTNHGMMMMGPPGTGKTLSGRIFLNKANATFIWVSAKDFYRMGAFGGMSMAFELAKELSPAILFIEDVDNWIDSWTVDYLKTEMDGIGRSTGTLTILTTNFPEMIPDALMDRPGRFHDILKFGLPNADIRGKMFEKWLPEVNATARALAVRDTDGMSGAHLYHLCKFAVDLVESESKSYDDAIALAIAKTKEQRELITGVQLQGSNYRPSRSFDGPATKALGVWVKGAVPFKATPAKPETDDWSVDHATYNVRSWAGVYDSKPSAEAWKKYATAFGWFDAKAGDEFDAYKLLHHDIVDGKLVVVWKGVAAAMREVLQSRTIPDADRRKAWAHLAQHYQQFNQTIPQFKGGDAVCEKCQKDACTCGVSVVGSKTPRLTERRLGLLNSAKDAIKQAIDHEEMKDQDEPQSFLKAANYKLTRALPKKDDPPDEDEEDDDDGDGEDGKQTGDDSETEEDAEKKKLKAAMTENRKTLLRSAQAHMMDAHDHDGMNGKSMARAIIKSAHALVEQAIPVPKAPKAPKQPDAGPVGTQPLQPGVGQQNPNLEFDPLKPNPEITAAANGLAVKFLTAVRSGQVEWQTLHDVRDGIAEEIERQEASAIPEEVLV